MVNQKTPQGCVTYYTILNDIIRPDRPMGYFPLQWQGAYDLYGNPADGLDDFDSLKMIRAAEELGRQLAQGERVACYIGRDGLKDIPPFAFSHEGTSERLLKGRVLHFDLDAEIFLREASYLPPQTTSDQMVNDTNLGINRSSLSTVSPSPEEPTPIARRSPLSKKETDKLFKKWVASYTPPNKPSQKERRNWYKQNGIPRARGDEIHRKLSPAHWKQPGAPKKTTQ
jgi:hypothetical protein